MAEQSSPFQFDDISLDEARCISRGPRMDPELSHTLKGKIQSLDNTATRITIQEGTGPDHDEKPPPPHRRRARNSCHYPPRVRRPPLLACHR
jgi:hypothetical protein